MTCRVLKIARQLQNRWLAAPVNNAELEEAHRTNALFDAHRDDPEFGYRFLFYEARDAGQVMAERTAWRICSTTGWWSAFGKKRGRTKRLGPLLDGILGVVSRSEQATRDVTQPRPPTLKAQREVLKVVQCHTSPSLGVTSFDSRDR